MSHTPDTLFAPVRLLRAPLVAALLAGACIAMPAFVSPAFADAAPAATESRDALISQLIRTAGWSDAFDRVVRTVRNRAVSDSRVKQMKHEQYHEYGLYIREGVSKDKLMAGARDSLNKALADMPDAEIKACVDAMAAPLPQRMLALARLIDDRNELGKINRYKVGLMTHAPSKERLALADRYLDASGVRAAYMEDQLAELRQMLAEAQPGLSDAELASQEKTLQPELDKRVTYGARADALAVFRDVSDEDLKSYVETLESPAVSGVLKRVNRVQIEVSQGAILDLLHKLAELVPPTAEDIAAVKASKEQAGMPAK